MSVKNAGSHRLKLLLLVLFAAVQFNCYSQSSPLLNGFAHNDYRHKHPLHDALENGFTNIEADVFYKNGKLIVAHVFPYFKGKRTLENLYLKPLLERVTDNNGKVYADYHAPVVLLIDIKTNAEETYQALKPILEKYRSILSSYEDGAVVQRAVTIVLSGHKPYRSIENEQNRLAFIDEDLRKVQRDSVIANVFTMASCKYSKLLKWDGRGLIPNTERIRLCKFVIMAHKLGTKVRLWASPEKKVVWDELLSCGVDLINTDRLPALKNYLASRTVTFAKAN
jgi:hypothetical protein